MTRAYIHLGRLTRNLRLLQEEAGSAHVWPVIKADAYGHGAEHNAGHVCRASLWRTQASANESWRVGGIEE
ncbi:MAG: alanine racemase [Gammaproteobacteria bacterium]|nr:alanine racemase [Gammaproteobacteria bacterium]